MRLQAFIFRSRIPAPAYTVFRWHARPDALEKLTPPWERVRIIERTGGIQDGGRVVLLVGYWPLQVRWVAEHFDYVEGRQFRDRQVRGPFAHWDHTHLVKPDGPDACWLEDRIKYALPLGGLGEFFAGWFVRRKLARLFEYRHRVTADEVLRSTHGDDAA
jgi:ligand-binding SRPBCC domain-containing protein